MTEENIAGRIARQDARQDADVAALEQDLAALEVNFQDHAEDNRAKDFSDRTRSKITRIEQKADRLHDSYVGEQAKLYRQDGQKRYSDAEHQELLDDLTRQRDEAFSGLKERVDNLSSEVGAKLEVASKPERYLSDEEMESATIRANFVREDVDGLPLGEVPGFLREAELSDDRVEKWLASRYALMRAERELEKLRESAASPGDVRAEEVSRHIREAREGAERLRERLQPPGAKGRTETLEKLREEAAGLTAHVRDKSLTHDERVARSWSPFR